ncbi:Rho guanine nucleotide exchange factor 1 [Cricetulus griseus]|uniref:Rho guanine nucleotide exchange factor 1 n=1 Tax=Cricetulus griseus TaxID=10029 RepID=G3I0N2_CRIGR|nr:Rho guanine nucleotide exchange factor 1 [Cricetulus griseus]
MGLFFLVLLQAPGPPRPGVMPVSIIGAEDEDFENELEVNSEDQNSQFQSLEQVKRRPAHLMALLQHVALQFEPGPLLCCLHADMLSSLGPKEAKKAFLDFYHSFLEKTASQQAAVSRQLEDFRSKRLMGMTPWEQELSLLEPWIGKDRGNYEARERHVAERLLSHLEEMHAAVVTAISLYMRHLGVRTKSGDKKSGRNFFRKKVMGNRRSDEPTKTKKGFSSILDPARWNRGEPPAPDFRHLKVEVDGEKPGPTDRKGGLGMPSRDRAAGTPGQDNPGISLHPLSADSPDHREPELLVTEAAHVRMLRVLHDLFYQPMADGGFFPLEELQNIFPSLDELIEVHSLFLDRLMKRRQESGYLIEEIGDVLLARSFALEQLKVKQRKEPRFCAFVQEAESRPRCRRLQLKDMIPTEMQRLTKYPLLLQSIGQNTEEPAEREKVELAAECCREILHHVNQAVRDMEDLLRLKDYQRRLDLTHLRQSSDPMLSEFKNLDITKKKLIHEGPLTWRVTRDKAVEVHVLLLDDLLLLLQRQDEKLLLKSHSRTLTPTPDGKTMLRPVLRLTSAMTREVATDHKAFYVIFTWDQEAQMYELVAQTSSERKNTRESLLSSSENGTGGREMPPADTRTERILSDLLPFCRPGPEGQLAATALQKVLSLKQLLLPAEEDGGLGPPQDGDGVPGGCSPGPVQIQEIQENLLSLEEAVKQLEELEEEFCRLRPLLSQLGGALSPSLAAPRAPERSVQTGESGAGPGCWGGVPCPTVPLSPVCLSPVPPYLYFLTLLSPSLLVSLL